MSATPSGLDVDVRRSGATAHIVLAGELDLATVANVERALEPLHADDGVRRLVLDLRGLEFIDSSGLNLLLRLDGEARSDGFELALVHGGEDIRRIFELTGLRDHFTTADPAELPGAEAA